MGALFFLIIVCIVLFVFSIVAGIRSLNKRLDKISSRQVTLDYLRSIKYEKERGE